MVDFKTNLESAAYSLVQTDESHFDALYTIANDPLLWAQHPNSDRWQRDVFVDFFQTALKNDLGCFTIIDKASGQTIGSTRFYSHEPQDSAVRLGYTFLARNFWGTRANSQIKSVLLNYAFSIVQKVYFDIGEKNYRSLKATQKLGAVFHAALEDDKVVYVLHKRDFNLSQP